MLVGHHMRRDGLRREIAPKIVRAQLWAGPEPDIIHSGNAAYFDASWCDPLGWSSRSAAIVALAAGSRFQSRELNHVPEPSGIRSRQPRNAWYDGILPTKFSGRFTYATLSAVIACVGRVPDLWHRVSGRRNKLCSIASGRRGGHSISENRRRRMAIRPAFFVTA